MERFLAIKFSVFGLQFSAVELQRLAENGTLNTENLGSRLVISNFPRIRPSEPVLETKRAEAIKIRLLSECCFAVPPFFPLCQP